MSGARTVAAIVAKLARGRAASNVPAGSMIVATAGNLFDEASAVEAAVRQGLVPVLAICGDGSHVEVHGVYVARVTAPGGDA